MDNKHKPLEKLDTTTVKGAIEFLSKLEDPNYKKGSSDSRVGLVGDSETVGGNKNEGSSFEEKGGDSNCNASNHIFSSNRYEHSSIQHSSLYSLKTRIVKYPPPRRSIQ